MSSLREARVAPAELVSSSPRLNKTSPRVSSPFKNLIFALRTPSFYFPSKTSMMKYGREVCRCSACINTDILIFLLFVPLFWLCNFLALFQQCHSNFILPPSLFLFFLFFNLFSFCTRWVETFGILRNNQYKIVIANYELLFRCIKNCRFWHL